MKLNDAQLGKPQVLYKGTKSAIEALSGIAEGSIAFATDTNELGTYDGSAWTWVSATALGTLGTKNPPIDADKVIYRDSAASDALVTSTWTQVKAFLKTWTDGLYAVLAHTHTGTTDSPKLAQSVTHESADTDSATSALHHTIGATATTAAAGNHAHALTSDSLRLIWLGW